MGFLADFIPFYPKKRGAEPPRPKFDIERALQVEVHAHPTLEMHRAANGELIVVVQREFYPGEKFIARFVTTNRYRRVVLDRYGEFMLNECLKPGTTLAEVAVRMAQEFGLESEKAKLGVIHLVKDLMLRGVVFLVRR